MIAREYYPHSFTIKRKQSSKRRFILFRYFTNRALIAFTVLFLLILSLFVVTQTFAAEQESNRVKTVCSVQIQPGDSLWSIAEHYYTDDFDSMKDYVAEIKRSNRLTSDTIHAGAYIIVPYYTSR